jgi:uroporphyrinogen-III synthase
VAFGGTLGAVGVKIVVTRARDQAEPLVERLEALGHEVVSCPLIEIEPLDPDAPLDVVSYDWVVVTSPNGAELLLDRVRGTLPRVAAIGPGTGDALRRRGVEPSLVPAVSTQEGLLDEFPAPSGRVLVAAAQDARRVLVDGLGAEFVALYRTRPLAPAFPDGDLVVLASSSAARAFAALGADVPAVSIGPQTTRTAEAAGVRIVAEARKHDLDGLVAAVEEACSSRS